MDINEFKSRIKSGALSGCFAFAGEEDYLKRYYLGELRSAIVTDEAFAPFNHIVFDGEDVKLASILDAVKAPPMMADYKLVEWHYPDFSSMKESELSDLEMLLETRAEYGYTTIAFLVGEDGVDLGTPKKKSKFITRFEKYIEFLRLDRSTDAQLAQWIRRHFEAAGVTFAQDVPTSLIFRSGHSMQQLKNEIDKLVAYAKANGISLSSREVELIATATTECDTFAFSNAILARDKQGALTALDDMKSRRVDPTVIIGMTAKVVCDLVNVAELVDDGVSLDDIAKALSMNAYKLKLYAASAKKLGRARCEAMLAELARVDTSSKFGGISGYTAIELFIMQNM